MLNLIELKDVAKKYGNECVIKGFSFNLLKGEIVVVKGASGTGKTTLLNILCGLVKPDSGEVIYNQQLFEGCKVGIPVVFQENESLLPWKTVLQNIKLVNKAASPETIDSVLDLVNLKGHEHKFPEMLSGGMKKRLCIAQALICQSKVILMDEPFSNLDAEMRMELEKVILELQQKTKLTVVIVTHDTMPQIEVCARTITSAQWRE